MAKPTDDPDVVDHIQKPVVAIDHEGDVQKFALFKEIFTRKSEQQVSAMNVIAYYLSVVLTRSVGLSNGLSLIPLRLRLHVADVLGRAWPLF